LQQYDLKNAHPKVKVLIFTNMETSADVAKAYDLGAYRCIVKSWTAPQGLSKVVEDALSGRLKSSSPKN
jgi:DNA-binding NarL/FixJ family response regulator